MKDSLFGHLALNFSASPENLATEAFCFILNRSETAKRAFIGLLSQITPSLSSTLKFETQLHTPGSSSDNYGNLFGDSRPDFAGRDDANNPIVLGEVKFWAGLTDNQPITYLKKYPESSVLLFIAPSKRIQLLWNELIRRCKEADLSFQPIQVGDNEFKSARFDEHPILALTSWRKILNTIRHAVETDGEIEILSDILQLEGLCNRMDQDAFLPLRSEELTSNIGKRMMQFGGLVDEIKDKLIEEGLIKSNTTSGSTAANVYVRYTYTKTGEYQINIQFNTILWSKYRETPIWLGIKRPTRPYSSFSPEAKKKLSKLEFEEPTRLFQDGDELLVPLFLPTGMEKSDILESLFKQIKEVTDILSNVNE